MVDSGEKAIAILGDIVGDHRRANKEMQMYSRYFCFCINWCMEET